MNNRVAIAASINMLVVGGLMAFVYTQYGTKTEMAELNSAADLLTLVAIMVVSTLTGLLTTSYVRKGAVSPDELARIIAAELKKEKGDR